MQAHSQCSTTLWRRAVRARQLACSNTEARALSGWPLTLLRLPREFQHQLGITNVRFL